MAKTKHVKLFKALMITWTLIALGAGMSILDLAFDPAYAELYYTEIRWLMILMPLYFIIWFACIFAGHWVIGKLFNRIYDEPKT